MKTTFTVRHFESGRDLETYSREEITKLEQFYDKIIACDILLEPSKDDDNPSRAELRIQVPGKLINAREEAQTYEHAINNVVDTAIRQLRKYKTRQYDNY